MSRSWWRTSDGLSASGNVAKALTTPLGAGVVAALLGKSTLATVLVAFGASAGLGAVVLAVAEARVRERERAEASAQEQADVKRQQVSAEAERLARLRVVPIRCVKEVKPYDIGVDQEAPQAKHEAGEGDHPEYLERDRDSDLVNALEAMLTTAQPCMLVLSGGSKAGKSRTLFVAAQKVLGDYHLIAPKQGPSNLSALVGPHGLPALAPGAVVVWLDDLEAFVGADDGMCTSMLEVGLAEWERPVVVLATEGGKGLARRSEQERGELEDPIRKLLRHALVRKVDLDVELTDRERARARLLYPAVVTEQLEQAGIGEYMIATDELVERLNHDGTTCPEGAAVVWAAIDWQRAGITAPVAKDDLQQLYVHYLTGVDPTPERFANGLEWARKPLYSSVALLSGDIAFSPFSYIVTYAAEQLRRAINPHAWDRIIQMASSEQALAVGLGAYRHDDLQRAERAWRRASRSPSDAVAGRALVNLGILLEERDDEGAEAAYREAEGRGDLDATQLLGRLLYDRGDLEGAEAAYRRGDEVGHGGVASGLGLLLWERGDPDGAEAAWRRGDERGDDGAASNLGFLLWERGDHNGAEAAWRRGDERGNGSAANNVGRLLWGRGDHNGAEAAWRRGDERGNGAAANNLGMLLERQGDHDDAEAAYRRGVERGHAAAANSLGLLLERRGDHDGAEQARARAVQLGSQRPPPTRWPVVPRALRDEQ